MNDIVIFEFPNFFSKEFTKDLIQFLNDNDDINCIIKEDKIYFSTRVEYDKFFSYMIDRTYGKLDNR